MLIRIYFFLLQYREPTKTIKAVLAMASLMQLVNQWEIQLLVLLSYMLQAFLFFAGGLRRRSKNRFFGFLVWAAYMGADMVAVYALGLISRHDNDAVVGSSDTLTGTHQLIFLWAPFLLIHLGGQDTITAFALEDNNLWLRHLLNLVVQVGVVSYVFWKSINKTNTRLLVMSTLLFVTGTIKYVERTWALRSGILKTLSESFAPLYIQQQLGMDTEDVINQLAEHMNRDDVASEVSVLTAALLSIKDVHSYFWNVGWPWPQFTISRLIWLHGSCAPLPKLLKVMDTELGLLYDCIYTKAVLFRTRGGIIFRCISQTCFIASFLLFIISNKQSYNYVDTAVTYALFVGGFFLEVCAVVTTVMSPWTWGWLEAHKCSFLASLFVRWHKRKNVMWSNSMGQYDMHDYMGQYDDQSSSWKQGVMAAIRKVVDACCGWEQRFWVSKLLDTKYVEVDKKTMRCIFEKVVECGRNIMNGNDLPQQ